MIFGTSSTSYRPFTWWWLDQQWHILYYILSASPYWLVFSRCLNTVLARMASCYYTNRWHPCVWKRVLFSLHQYPDKSTHQLWFNIVHRYNLDCYLLSLFPFEPRFDIVWPNQFVAQKIWNSLLLLCTSLCIVPPTLSLSNKKLRTNKFNSAVALLGEVIFLVKEEFVGHDIFKGVVIKVLPPRPNKKMYRTKYENDDEKYITLQEFITSTTTE